MVILGVTGGVASGKTLVAGLFARLGAEVLDADRAGHDVLRDPEVRQAIRHRWGDGVLGPDGHIDRSAVAQLVFAPPPEGPRQLSFLEQLTHPRIGDRLRRQASQLARRGDVPAAVLDAAVLFKAGWDTFCDKIVFVDVSPALRAQRAQQRGWSRQELQAREAAQRPLEFKRARADIVIDNSGTVEQTRAQVQRIWNSLVDRATL
jgi:dephospho-CoA kinase